MAIAGNDISIANTASAVNQITFNPIITALTGTGAVNPSVTTPQTLTSSPVANSSPTDTNSLWGGLGLGGTAKSPAAIGAGQYVPGVSTNPNALSVTTNPQTMIWILLFGGMGLVLLMGGGHHGGRRH